MQAHHQAAVVVWGQMTHGHDGQQQGPLLLLPLLHLAPQLLLPQHAHHCPVVLALGLLAAALLHQLAGEEPHLLQRGVARHHLLPLPLVPLLPLVLCQLLVLPPVLPAQHRPLQHQPCPLAA